MNEAFRFVSAPSTHRSRKTEPARTDGVRKSKTIRESNKNGGCPGSRRCCETWECRVPTKERPHDSHVSNPARHGAPQLMFVPSSRSYGHHQNFCVVDFDRTFLAAQIPPKAAPRHSS